MSRRGVSLAELVVALTLLGLVAGSALGVLRRTQDLYRAQALRADLHQTLRAAATYFPIALRELDATDGDVSRLAPTMLTIRAPRTLAFVCRPPRPEARASSATLTVRRAPVYGTRDFAPGSDSVWILDLADRAASGSPAWRLGAVEAVGSEQCPDGAPGRQLAVALRPSDIAPPSVVVSGAPVLGFEQVTYLLYRSSGDGQWYVGVRDVAGLQPLFGPVPPNGLAFTYFDSAGGATTDPSRVRVIEVRVRMQAGPVRGTDGRLDFLRDSAISSVALRNNRRF